jgi:hypothetical protein
MSNPFHPTLRDMRLPHLAPFQSEDSGNQRILSFHSRCHKVRYDSPLAGVGMITVSRHVSGDFGPSALIGMAAA